MLILEDNPFYILNASTRDNRRKLNLLAEEASWTGGEQAEEAHAALLHMSKRLGAELSWFSACSNDVVDEYRHWISSYDPEHCTPLPDPDRLEKPLARFNALCLLFHTWPLFDSNFAAAIFASLDRVLTQIKEDDVEQSINADRKEAGFNAIEEDEYLHQQLQEYLRSRLKDLLRHLDVTANLGTFKSLITSLKDQLSEGGIIQEMILSEYLMLVHDNCSKLEETIYSIANTGNQKQCINIDRIKNLFSDWNSYMKYYIYLSNYPNDEIKKMCHTVRELLVRYINDIQPSTESIQVYDYFHTRTATISHTSRTRGLQMVIPTVKYFISLFETLKVPEVKMLNDDITQIEKMINDDQTKLRAYIQKNGFVAK